MAYVKADFDPDGLDSWTLVSDLCSVQLPPKDREFVKECKELRSVGGGSLPHETMGRLRKLYAGSWEKIRDLYEAREKARLSRYSKETIDAVGRRRKKDEGDFGI